MTKKKTLLCATSNPRKFAIGKRAFSRFDITLQKVAIDIDEIQGEDPEVILRDKAVKAYEIVRQPVLVSDDSWSIPALGGFPGAYMKSMNVWFKPEDFLPVKPRYKPQARRQSGQEMLSIFKAIAARHNTNVKGKK